MERNNSNDGRHIGGALRTLRAHEAERFASYVTAYADDYWPVTDAIKLVDYELSESACTQRIARVTRDSLATRVGEPCWARVWVAEGERGELVGHVSLRWRREQHTAHRARAEIAVLPPYRSLGLGLRLLGMAAEWAERNTHLDWLDVSCESGNTAVLSLLSTAGFFEVGRTPDLFRAGTRCIDAVALTRRLRAQAPAVG